MSGRAAALLERLATHTSDDLVEERYLRSVQELLSTTDAPFDRSQYNPGHITASSYVLDEGMRRVLLIYHSKLHRWLQPGGHVEPSDSDIEEAARREVLEETSLSDLELMGSGVLDVDVHEIPARGDMPAHRHYDVRLLFRSASASAEAGSDADAVRWVPLADVENVDTDESVMRAVRKIRARVESPHSLTWCASEAAGLITRMDITPRLPRAVCDLIVRDGRELVGEECPSVVLDGARAGVVQLPPSSVTSWLALELRGRDLMRSGGSDRARVVFEEALEQIPADELAHRAWLLGLLAQARTVDGQHARGERAWRQALELSLQASLDVDADICRLGLARCQARQGDRIEAREWAVQVLSGAAPASLRYEAAHMLLMLGGRWDAYRATMVEVLRLGAWWGRAEQRADLLARSARIASDYGHVDDACAWWDAAASSFSRAGDATRERAARIAEGRLRSFDVDVDEPEGLSGMLWGAERALRSGDGPAAQRFAYRALACAEDSRRSEDLLEAWAMVAMVRLYRGDPGDALPRFERCRRGYADALHTVGESLMCSMVVVSEWMLGHLAQASSRSMEVRGHPDAPHAVRVAGFAEKIVALGEIDPLAMRQREPLGPLGDSERLEIALLDHLYRSLRAAKCS